MCIRDRDTTPRFKYKTIERNQGNSQINKKEDYHTSDEYEEEVTVQRVTPKYSTIERQRPARVDTEESDFEYKQEETEIEDRPKPKYTSIQRSRPTTEEGNVETTTSRHVLNNYKSKS